MGRVGGSSSIGKYIGTIETPFGVPIQTALLSLFSRAGVKCADVEKAFSRWVRAGVDENIQPCLS